MGTRGNHFAFVGSNHFAFVGSSTSRIYPDVAPQVEVSKTSSDVIIRAISTTESNKP
jgi:hypothetical protein